MTLCHRTVEDCHGGWRQPMCDPEGCSTVWGAVGGGGGTPTPLRRGGGASYNPPGYSPLDYIPAGNIVPQVMVPHVIAPTSQHPML